MARPQKEGLDYFPLDVDIDQDDKVALIEAQHGVTGFAIVIKLLMKIYKNGYYYNWTEKEQLLFSRSINVDINSINDVINDCLKWELFSKTVFEKQAILTSKGIQLRYLEAVSRRQEVKIPKSHLLICGDKVNDYKNLVIDNINDENDDINPQSKVKKRIVKKRKEEKHKYAEFVSMLPSEHKKLLDQFGQAGTDDRIERLNLYKGSTGKKYKSDYLTILNWERKNSNDKGGSKVETDQYSNLF
ncbi:MAG: DUF4373 domain-containing protein [Bacillus sp. (in: firmicutes)]